MWLPLLLVLTAACSTAAQPQSGTATCQAIVTLSTNWVQTSNNATFASVNLDIISTQPTIVPVPWTLTLKNAAYGMIKQASAPSVQLYPLSQEDPQPSATPLHIRCQLVVQAHKQKHQTYPGLFTPETCARA